MYQTQYRWIYNAFLGTYQLVPVQVFVPVVQPVFPTVPVIYFQPGGFAPLIIRG